ncbi:hypothetical protein [Virgibacillus salexigens]|uniref:hypothetical protein n=1 Tax=Virgibacillus massiliensis TaxID=1462526 RepID=UPI00136E4C5D|nr:hypothetical protein [Virgibacillus massiliensis]MYL43997.1 hypothetical protein [Virgibacillus massiliensis]
MNSLLSRIYQYHKKINQNNKSFIKFIGIVMGVAFLSYTFIFMDSYNYNEIHMSVFDKLYGKPLNEESSLIDVAMYYDLALSTLLPVMLTSVLYIILKLMFTFTIGYFLGMASIYILLNIFNMYKVNRKINEDDYLS